MDKANTPVDRKARLYDIAHGRPLLTIQDKVHPSNAALIVVDVQNDFCAEGGMMHSEGLDLTMVQEMVPSLRELIASARGAGVVCIFVKNVYSTPSNSYLSDSWLEQAFRRRGASYIDRSVCSVEGWNGQFYGGVEPMEGDPVIIKHRYCAFTNTDLELVLRAHNIRTVIVAGVATNVCVETTARSAFVRDYYVIIPREAVATYDPHEQSGSLKVLDRYFGEVVPITSITRHWQ